MTTTAKTVLTLVILVILGVGAWWYISSQSGAPAPYVAPTEQAATTTAATNTSQAASVNQGIGISATDTSDAALNSDLSAIDQQNSGLSSDSANINQSTAQ